MRPRFAEYFGDTPKRFAIGLSPLGYFGYYFFAVFGSVVKFFRDEEIDVYALVGWNEKRVVFCHLNNADIVFSAEFNDASNACLRFASFGVELYFNCIAPQCEAGIAFGNFDIVFHSRDIHESSAEFGNLDDPFQACLLGCE